jgi:KaiC/GvpD/RAD55 family RecA-like ATPase
MIITPANDPQKALIIETQFHFNTLLKRGGLATRKVPTGIEGFDVLADGGFPHNSVNMVSGPSGSAKSLFCLQFIFNGAEQFSEPGIYVSYEESANILRMTLKNFGMNTEPHETNGNMNIVDIGEMRKLSKGDEFLDFDSLESMLSGLIDATGAKRLVVDSLAVLGLHYDKLNDFRRELFQFGRFLSEKEITSLLVTEADDSGTLTRFGIEQFIADSFIYLGLDNVKGELRRTIVVRKMRLTNHDVCVHPFLITNKGLKISSDVRVEGV